MCVCVWMLASGGLCEPSTCHNINMHTDTQATDNIHTTQMSDVLNSLNDGDDGGDGVCLI